MQFLYVDITLRSDENGCTRHLQATLSTYTYIYTLSKYTCQPKNKGDRDGNETIQEEKERQEKGRKKTLINTHRYNE